MIRFWLLLLGALSIGAAAHAEDMIEPGQWKVTTATTVNGVVQPAPEKMRCISTDQAADVVKTFGPVVALDDALGELARLDERKMQVVEMRFFGGLSVEETAEVLKVSPATVKRDWRIARFWLYRELDGGTGYGSGTLETAR